MLQSQVLSLLAQIFSQGPLYAQGSPESKEEKSKLHDPPDYRDYSQDHEHHDSEQNRFPVDNLFAIFPDPSVNKASQYQRRQEHCPN